MSFIETACEKNALRTLKAIKAAFVEGYCYKRKGAYETVEKALNERYPSLLQTIKSIYCVDSEEEE